MKFELPPLVPNKKPVETTVVVAMSGGVDSSCVAALCVQAGYKTIGVTLQLWDYMAEPDKNGKKLGTCCAIDDVSDAKYTCKTLGIKHHTLHVENDFKTAVIDDFVETYLSGATPIPCVRCNQRIKFVNLLQEAKKLGADVVVTGHYAQKDWVNGRAILKKGADPKKDQSYYLFTTTQAQLEYVNFPLGHLTKPETRALAEELNLHVADKKESMDICFVPNGDYRKVVQKFAPQAQKQGDIISTKGETLGQHQGIVGYTVGQRKGLGGGTKKPMYVVKIKPQENQVVIGEKADLARKKFIVKEINWLDTNPLDGQKVYVKARAQHPSAPATLKDLGQGRVEVTFDTPEKEIAPGQAAVFYNENDHLLGGGWIC